jgi:hypothetical protein|tara:strand:+ start:31395 stop:31583 length:189 start_codon:yes stop_codon:yes gene_type:complete
LASVSNDKDATFIEHLEEAEDRCLNKVQEIMSDAVRMLDSEYEALKKSHEYMRRLKAQMKSI